jgi:hypothetical protein
MIVMTIANSHNPLRAGLFLSILVLLCSSCERNPIEPADDRPLISSSAYKNVVLKLMDYDILHITHQAGLELRSSTVARVGIGAKDSASYREMLSVPSTYDQNARAFILHFDYSVATDSSKIQAPLTIRYYAVDSTYSDVDTTVDLYKYPYQSAQVFVTRAIRPYMDKFQDIDRIGAKFYFHVLGPNGLYEYDLNNHQTKYLYPYSAGDHIAADSNFVYCDVGHEGIDRHSISTGSLDKRFLSFSPLSIFGMAIFQQSLFVLVGNSGTNKLSLKKFTLAGTPIDSLPYPRGAYYMTIYDSVVYSVDWYTRGVDQISRFDLRTKTFLSNLIAPAKACDGIKVFGDQLYFCVFWKGYVGVMPIGDLMPIPSAKKETTHLIRRAPDNSLE